MYSVLEQHQTVGWLELVMNHKDFSQTVENIFTLSFLVSTRSLQKSACDQSLHWQQTSAMPLFVQGKSSSCNDKSSTVLSMACFHVHICHLYNQGPGHDVVLFGIMSSVQYGCCTSAINYSSACIPWSIGSIYCSAQACGSSVMTFMAHVQLGSSVYFTVCVTTG